MINDLIDRYQFTLFWLFYVGYVAGVFQLVGMGR